MSDRLMVAVRLVRTVAGRRIKHLDVALLVGGVGLGTLLLMMWITKDVFLRDHEALRMRVAAERLEKHLLAESKGQFATVETFRPREAGEATVYLRLRDEGSGRIGLASCTFEEGTGRAVCQAILPTGEELHDIIVRTR